MGKTQENLHEKDFFLSGELNGCACACVIYLCARKFYCTTLNCKVLGYEFLIIRLSSHFLWHLSFPGPHLLSTLGFFFSFVDIQLHLLQ